MEAQQAPTPSPINPVPLNVPTQTGSLPPTSPSTEKRKKRGPLIAGLITALIVTVVWIYPEYKSYTDTPSNEVVAPMSEDEVIKIPLGQLYAEYFEDPTQTRANYTDKWLQISGQHWGHFSSDESDGYKSVSLEAESYLTSEARLSCKFDQDMPKGTDFQEYLIVKGQMTEKEIKNMFTGEVVQGFTLEHCSVVSNTAEPTNEHEVRTEPLSSQVPANEILKIDSKQFLSELSDAQDDEDPLNDKYFDKWIELNAHYSQKYEFGVTKKIMVYEFKLDNDTNKTTVTCAKMDPEPNEDSLKENDAVTMKARFDKYAYYSTEESMLYLDYCTVLD